MFKKILIAEDMDFINSGIKAELTKLGIAQIDSIQYCDEALLKLKRAHLDGVPYDLLISDLSFETDGTIQKLTSGEALVKAVREVFTDLKIIVFSIEDKAYTIQTLFNDYAISGYVWKGREGLRELKQALQLISTSDGHYISTHCAKSMSKSKEIEIVAYDIFMISCLAEGLSQEQISEAMKQKKWSPTSVSSIEKRLKFLRDYFNANNTAHLVAIVKDLGLV